MLVRQSLGWSLIERLRAFTMGAIVVVAGLYSLVQLTRFAPFSHRADSFVAGIAAGAALFCVVIWVADRRSPSPRVS